MPEPSDGVVHIEFSRPSHRLGGTVVGTVRLEKPRSSTVSSRQWLSKGTFQAVGRCRLDPRWHNVAAYQNVYGRHPHQDISVQQHPHAKNTVWFWATPIIDLLTVPERHHGTSWNETRPQPTHITEWPSPRTSTRRNDETRHLEEQHRAFTFRFDLPADLPHSLSCMSCRYYYTVQIHMRLEHETESSLFERRFTVLTRLPKTPIPPLPTSSSLQQSSVAHVMAHSAGLPSFLSAKDLYQAKGSITVQHDTRRPSCQTMRLDDPQGRPVCLLTIIGASQVHPGGRVQLQLDFSRHYTPTHHVSACLSGSEVAIHSHGQRKRCRTYLYSPSHHRVDPQCTDRVSLDLLVPHDAPCTIVTPLLEISMQIILDVSIRIDDAFRNLRVEMPLSIAHPEPRDDHPDEEGADGLSRVILFERLVRQGEPTFETLDILPELSLLSRSMAEQCGLATGSTSSSHEHA